LADIQRCFLEDGAVSTYIIFVPLVYLGRHCLYTLYCIRNP